MTALDTRDVSYQVRVLKNGVEAGEILWQQKNAPTVMWDKDGQIKSSFLGQFYPPSAADLLTDELKPYAIINGVEYPLGVFRAATLSRVNTTYGSMLSIEAYDRCWKLQSTRTESVIHFNAGTLYTTAIDQLLTECGISLRLVTPSTAALSTDREDWEIGTDYLTIVNQLLSEIAYNELWFDVDGVARVEPYLEVSKRLLTHKYGEKGLGIYNPVVGDSSVETDLFSKPNVFICVCSNPELAEPMVAVSENDNPASITSIFRRGMRIAQRYQVENTASQAELQAYADKLRLESMFSTETLSFETLAEGGHGLGDSLSIDDRRLGGIYEETAWSITMMAGELMKHTAKRELSSI